MTVTVLPGASSRPPAETSSVVAGSESASLTAGTVTGSGVDSGPGAGSATAEGAGFGLG